MKLRETLKEFSIITAGTTIVAAAVFFFMLPSHVSVGSGAALAMVLSNFIPLSVSAITLIMNAGDTNGWRMKFSVKYGDVIVSVSTKGVDPEWVYQQLTGLISE